MAVDVISGGVMSRKFQLLAIGSTIAVITAGGLVYANATSSDGDQYCRTKAGYIRLSTTGECRRAEVPVDFQPGAQGPQGEPGAQGPQGEPGAAGRNGTGVALTGAFRLHLLTADGRDLGEVIPGMGPASCVDDGGILCFEPMTGQITPREGNQFETPNCSGPIWASGAWYGTVYSRRAYKFAAPFGWQPWWPNGIGVWDGQPEQTFVVRSRLENDICETFSEPWEATGYKYNRLSSPPAPLGPLAFGVVLP